MLLWTFKVGKVAKGSIRRTQKTRVNFCHPPFFTNQFVHLCHCQDKEDGVTFGCHLVGDTTVGGLG